MEKLHDFNLKEALNDPENIALALDLAAEDGDTQGIINILNALARHKGFSQVAQDIGIDRTTVFKALSPSGNPTTTNFLALCKGLGVKLHFEVEKIL